MTLAKVRWKTQSSRVNFNGVYFYPINQSFPVDMGVSILLETHHNLLHT